MTGREEVVWEGLDSSWRSVRFSSKVVSSGNVVNDDVGDIGDGGVSWASSDSPAFLDAALVVGVLVDVRCRP